MSRLSETTSVSSTNSLQRIPTSQLCPGMFLVRVMDSWWKSPFFSHRRLLKSSTEVQQLICSGIQEVEIDTSKGVAVSSESEAECDEGMLEVTEAVSIMVSCDQEDVAARTQRTGSPECESEESKVRAEIVQVREDVMAAVDGAFEGVKTGQPISQPVVHAAAQVLVQQALAYPALLAEVSLLDSLKQFDKTLYAHVVDTAVYSILLGLQLGWNDGALEKIGVAGLLHDVGYMRLPQNVVNAQWRGGSDCSLLQKHVVMAEILLTRHGQFSSDIICMVKDHHVYLDGSGYPEDSGGQPASESAQLLATVNYFDELLIMGGPVGSLPAALALRRMYQEAKRGKFPIPFMDAMIRMLGVFPVGTVVQLSTDEQAVVVKQNTDSGVKPQVEIFRNSDGKILEPPQVWDLAKDANSRHDVSITRLLDPSEYSLNLQEFFNRDVE